MTTSMSVTEISRAVVTIGGVCLSGTRCPRRWRAFSRSRCLCFVPLIGSSLKTLFSPRRWRLRSRERTCRRLARTSERHGARRRRVPWWWSATLGIRRTPNRIAVPAAEADAAQCDRTFVLPDTCPTRKLITNISDIFTHWRVMV